MNPHQVTKDFERELCAYTGAPYAVSVNSCTMALLLAVAWHFRNVHPRHRHEYNVAGWMNRREVEIPKHTYVSVPMSIVHAGGRPTFRDEDWIGAYQLKPLPVWDSARYFTSGLYKGKTAAVFTSRDNFHETSQIAINRDCSGSMVCVSFHASKTLGDTQGGAILLDDFEAYQWLKRARFDGRTEGLAPKDDHFDTLGWHCYLSPDVAARLLWKLSVLPKNNEPMPNDDYPDLSQMSIFQ